MKKIFIFLISMYFIIGNSTDTFAQSTKRDTVTISGNCGDCKVRIEEAAYIKGVKSAIWDINTKVLTVVYNSKKTNLDKIETSIAKVGHDSKGHIAKDEDYNKIPACCAYRTGACGHE